MSYVHITHDCPRDKNVILTSYVGLAGETQVDEYPSGGASAAHQFTYWEARYDLRRLHDRERRTSYVLASRSFGNKQADPVPKAAIEAVARRSRTRTRG